MAAAPAADALYILVRKAGTNLAGQVDLAYQGAGGLPFDPTEIDWRQKTVEKGRGGRPFCQILQPWTRCEDGSDAVVGQQGPSQPADCGF